MGRRIAVLKGNTLKFIHIDIGKLIRKWMIFFNLTKVSQVKIHKRDLT